MTTLDTVARDVVEDGLREVRDFFDNRGWERLDSKEGVIATTRYVYRTNRNTVVKIANKPLNEDVILAEAANWEQYQDPTLFAPILAHGDTWVEMMECRRIDMTYRESIKRAYHQKLDERGLEINDLHLGNLGILRENGEVVALDYPTVKEK